jgi:hypothetical protein
MFVTPAIGVPVPPHPVDEEALNLHEKTLGTLGKARKHRFDAAVLPEPQHGADPGDGS